MKVSFIWFDIGYTLLYMQRETTYQQALREFGVEVPLKEIEKEFHLTDKLFMREYPRVFLESAETYMPWFLGMMNYRLGVSLNLCELTACWEEIKRKTENYWIPFDGVAQLLDELKRKSVGLGIISNWDHSARDILAGADLSDYFDHFVISSEVGHTKPDPEIFKIALEKSGVSAQECFYIGDNYYADALGCRGVGMKALIINRFGSIGVEEIDDCPIINHISQVLDHI